ncbi:MAG TPA: hypothetical protein VF799_03650 [Geobacteraceae bacterium]
MTLQVLIFVLLVPILIWAFNTFDNLIKLECEKFHEQWVADGAPSGIYWRPTDYRPSLQGALATQKAMFMLFFRRPGWMESSPYALSLHRRYRMLVLSWNVGLVCWFSVWGRMS